MKLQDLFEIKRTTIKSKSGFPSYTTKLDYAGVTVKGNFNASYTNVTSLEGAPKWVGGDFMLAGTRQLKSLKGGPSYVGGNFLCSSTKLTSLEGIPEHIGGYCEISYNQMPSLHNIHKHVKYIGGKDGLYPSHTVKSHVLGVMFIKGLKKIQFLNPTADQIQIAYIINKHLPGGNPHEAQEELIEAGLSEYAKL